MKKRRKRRATPQPPVDINPPHGEPLDELFGQLAIVGQWVARCLTHGVTACSGCRKTMKSTDKKFQEWRYLGALGWYCPPCLKRP